MNNDCEKCGQTFNNNKLAEYSTNVLGVQITLYNAVEKNQCGCVNGDHEIKIINLHGLIAAAAVTRAACEVKLSGTDIKFLRKAIKKSAKKMAEDLGIAPETLSRWENDDRPINPTSEKLLRVTVVAHLQDDAPLIDVDVKQISDMEIQGFTQQGYKHHMYFELIRYKDRRGGNMEDEYERKVA